ncbi:MAG TPA: hypothetical protein VI408_01320 [Gaiellaceae bacterium]
MWQDVRELVAPPEWHAFKNRVASTYAWAVPTEEAVAAVARHAPRVVEVGAGSGYWAWMLSQAGVDVVAFDASPPGWTWHPVAVGTELAVMSYPERALFLCWPPWNTAMAANALACHRGEVVVYVGEWNGGSAEPAFFARLADAYDVVEAVALPQWASRADLLTVHRLREG